MSSTYSPMEKSMARALEHMPFAKNVIKSLYSRLVYWHYKKAYTHREIIPLRSVSDDPQGENFFGYYDKSPLNISGSHIIYHHSTLPTSQKPNPTKSVTVILQEAHSGKILAQLPSFAYNWQQGTKLQWLSNTRFVFNDYDPSADCYVAKIYDMKAGSIVNALPIAIYDCYGEDFALSLNFDRLARLAPDYGYLNRLDKPISLDNLESDGIRLIDMQNGESCLIVTLRQLVELEPAISMQSASHTVNHIMIAPDGKHFIFIHRWYKNGRRFDRLIQANNDGSGLKVLAGFGMVSHCFWIDESIILAYMRGPGGQDAYWLINTETGELTHFAQGALDKYGDGHPHVHGDWLVTDTYPDKARLQHLLFCNWKTGEVQELGEFFHGFDFHGETRCDLHPRFSPDGTKIFVDSVHTGKRRFYLLDVCGNGQQ